MAFRVDKERCLVADVRAVVELSVRERMSTESTLGNQMAATAAAVPGPRRMTKRQDARAARRFGGPGRLGRQDGNVDSALEYMEEDCCRFVEKGKDHKGQFAQGPVPRWKPSSARACSHKV